MSGHVFRVVSNAPSRTLLTMVLSTSVGTAWFSAKRTELVRAASVGFVCLGISIERGCGFEHIFPVRAKGTRRLWPSWPPLVSCVRAWGFCGLSHISAISISESRNTAPRDTVV